MDKTMGILFNRNKKVFFFSLFSLVKTTLEWYRKTNNDFKDIIYKLHLLYKLRFKTLSELCSLCKHFDTLRLKKKKKEKEEKKKKVSYFTLILFYKVICRLDAPERAARI